MKLCFSFPATDTMRDRSQTVSTLVFCNVGPAVGLVLGSLVLAGCEGAAAAHHTSTVRDSSGVTIVENSDPVWSEGEAWRLADQPTVDIGDRQDDPNYQLFRVASAIQLGDDRIMIANAGTHELRFYDRDGTYDATTGGAGDGPGEFRNVGWVERFAADSLIAYDLKHRRLSVFDTRGRFGRSIALRATEGVPYPFVLGVFTTAGFLIQGSSASVFEAPLGFYRGDASLYRYSFDGNSSSSVGSYPGTDEGFLRINGDGKRVRAWLVFGRSTTFAVHGDQFYVAANDTYEIQMHGSGGGLRSLIRVDRDLIEVTEAHLDLFRKSFLEERASDERSLQVMDGLLRGQPHSPAMPAYATVRIDNIGNLWVQEYSLPGDDRICWTVFDRHGILLGSVGFPERFRALDIGEDYVLGVWTDDMDLEHVRLYDLRKP